MSHPYCGDSDNEYRTCDHCEKMIRPDEPLLRIEGWDDRVCYECIETFNKEAAAQQSLSIDFRETIADICGINPPIKISEPAARLIKNIIMKELKKGA